MADIRSVTIEDVAAAASVSVATVSRALRGLDNVAHSTRQKVELAAAELGYVANPAAAKLAAGSSKTIVVAVSTSRAGSQPRSSAGSRQCCQRFAMTRR